MSDSVSSQSLEDSVVLTNDIPDEAVEAAASDDKTPGFTLAFCTFQWDCTVPL